MKYLLILLVIITLFSCKKDKITKNTNKQPIATPTKKIKKSYKDELKERWKEKDEVKPQQIDEENLSLAIELIKKLKENGLHHFYLEDHLIEKNVFGISQITIIPRGIGNYKITKEPNKYIITGNTISIANGIMMKDISTCKITFNTDNINIKYYMLNKLDFEETFDF